MGLTEGSETSAKLNLTPGKYPTENIQDSEHGENLKSRKRKMPCYAEKRTPDHPTRRLVIVEMYKKNLLSPYKRMSGSESSPAPFS
jgi:hypothetical protein